MHQRPPFSRGAALLAGPLLASCLAGYDPCFVPPSVVPANLLRILAVRSDPPDLIVDLEQSGEVVLQIRALVVSNSGATLRGRLCAPTTDKRCSPDLPLQAGPATPPDFDPTLELHVPLELIRAARDQDPLKGYGGIQVLLDLEAVDDRGSATASKTLLFFPREKAPAPNQPIEVERIDFTSDGTRIASGARYQAVGLEVAKAYGLRPRLAPPPGQPDGTSPLEWFDVTDLSGRTVHLREQVAYSFFATPQYLFGDLQGAGQVPVGVYLPGADLGDEPAEGVPEPANGLVRFNPIKNGIGRVWVVARESRGAVAWLAVDVGAEDNRHCGPCPTLFFGCE